MEEMIAFCGLPCYECGAYLATKNNDDEKRTEVAEFWAKKYNADIKPEDINCEGCTSKGEVHFSYCSVCGIRKCGTEKAVANCAHCDEYPCARLGEFFKMAPECKKALDEIRSRL